ncbi:MAG: ParA family protein [Leptolyngbyaceae cyanobacterium SM1_1_3]|nr:ParA family protein [Leptolyngbyaceae cyanobacterium SM1_1_3]NJN01017.1 ParA family protein [Leptolyngbyaceae cyanobacterium RM1_1_2]
MPKQLRIAVMSNAGGSGKSTLTVNVGYELAAQGYSVALFGLDPNGSLTLFCGLPDPPVEDTLNRVFQKDFDGNWPLFNCWSEKTSRVQVCLGGLIMTEAAQRLVLLDRKAYILADHLEDYPLPHDFILFDCPGTIDMLHSAALTASNYVLIPIQPDDKDIDGAAKLLEWIFDSIRTLRLKPAPEIMGFVPNRVRLGDRAQHRDNMGLSNREKTAQDPPSLPDMLAAMKIHCFSLIKDSAEIGNAASIGLPLKSYRPAHAANKNFKEIARVIQKKLSSQS